MCQFDFPLCCKVTIEYKLLYKKKKILQYEFLYKTSKKWLPLEKNTSPFISTKISSNYS
jgi:hypothetical protein